MESPADSKQSSLKPTPERICPWCQESVSHRAKKCKFCGEWLVETFLDWPSRALQALGYVAMAFSALVAIAAWTQTNRMADAADGPLGAASLGASMLPVILFRAVSVWILIQGCLVGTLLIAFAQRGPRRPAQ